jgi:hypothetical protein
MSEYDHMMRGGKTGSGPMADHIQACLLHFFHYSARLHR